MPPACFHFLPRATMDKADPKIFVVDDDRSILESLSALLKSVGFRPKTFSSAEQFLEEARLDEGDCLILDVRMPGLSGLDLHDKLTASGCDLPIVFITAHEEEKTRLDAAGSRAVAVLRKPFEDQELLDAISQALRRGRAGKDNESYC
jgi:FixJ family two-component response regulator